MIDSQLSSEITILIIDSFKTYIGLYHKLYHDEYDIYLHKGGIIEIVLNHNRGTGSLTSSCVSVLINLTNNIMIRYHNAYNSAFCGVLHNENVDYDEFDPSTILDKLVMLHVYNTLQLHTRYATYIQDTNTIYIKSLRITLLCDLFTLYDSKNETTTEIHRGIHNESKMIEFVLRSNHED
jgi:hypothetical protein